MDENEFREMVKGVAERFEADESFSVSDAAVEELIEPGLPHLSDVTDDLSKGKVTKEFLEGCVYGVLKNAKGIAEDWSRNSIGEDTTRESMKRDCPYLFWC